MILIWLLTFLLVLTCLFLILLVLVQLPKKEAGLGQAFGSGATDALFGPGSGNMLTKLTKWTGIIFFVLVVSIWMLYGHDRRAKGADYRAKLSAAEKAALLPPPPNTPTNAPGTNAPVKKDTNAAINLLTPATNTSTPPKP